MKKQSIQLKNIVWGEKNNKNFTSWPVVFIDS